MVGGERLVRENCFYGGFRLLPIRRSITLSNWLLCWWTRWTAARRWASCRRFPKPTPRSIGAAVMAAMREGSRILLVALEGDEIQGAVQLGLRAARERKSSRGRR